MSESRSESPYRVLGLSPGASDEDVKSAYRKLAKQYHPDINPDDPDAEEQFKKVSDAYKTLLERRERLRNADATDSKLTRSDDPDAVGSLPNDVRIRLILTLEDLIEAGKREVQFSRAVICTVCRGATKADDGKICRACDGSGEMKKPASATIKYPAGVRQGYRFSLPGLGHKRSSTAPPGNLVIEIVYKPHPYLEVVDDDLHYRGLIGLDTFIEGGKLKVPSLEGVLEVTIPAHTPDGRILKIPGRGLPSFNGTPVGDLFVKLELCLPKKLSSKERHKIRELMELPGFRPHDDETGFVPRVE